MIRARELTKKYGDKTAVDGLDFAVKPGLVTGFLGPNGAGKSTTMRMILGLDRPTSGAVTVNGVPHEDSVAPLREVGALLEAHAVHPGRSARNHLRWLAATNAIPDARVDEILAQVGLTEVADKRAGKFSLGMRQRLGIASALIGDPPVVILDEPVNGLDSEGIRWVRHLCRQLADEGRTVFVSSHLMTEMALMADHLLVIGQGRILADDPMTEFMAGHAPSYVRIRTRDRVQARAALTGVAAELTEGDDELRVSGLGAEAVGDLLFDAGVRVHELTAVQSSLEEAFMALTAESVEYRADTARPTSDLVAQGALR
ncbi:ABC transporter ATP-binding protein [Gordonia hydrophobica]|uniref:ABC transporter ATP-binding protein n=1 Tax=Gordonia hydrophobica TaxID=40516 RepID=A0ABZ2U2A2_9ACTN|nr:ABC transporter ATP-binding protein [Gordonia hydrophobica]MBM7368904.1 ABC-2 type transport system ATP-binding protein [Gordonia hydrophobica]